MVGIEAFLQIGKPLDAVVEHRLGVIVKVDAAGIGAIERGEAEAREIVDAQLLEKLCGRHDASVLQT